MKPSMTLAVTMFTIVAVVHVARIVLGWKVVIGEQVMAMGGTMIPMWVSYVSVVVASGLAYMLWRDSR